MRRVHICLIDSPKTTRYSANWHVKRHTKKHQILTFEKLEPGNVERMTTTIIRVVADCWLIGATLFKTKIICYIFPEGLKFFWLWCFVCLRFPYLGWVGCIMQMLSCFDTHENNLRPQCSCFGLIDTDTTQQALPAHLSEPTMTSLSLPSESPKSGHPLPLLPSTVNGTTVSHHIPLHWPWHTYPWVTMPG